jgi:hypothetical protein
MNPRSALFRSITIFITLLLVGVGCGSSSGSSTEDALRAELAETKAQLDQAQKVIATLQTGDDTETTASDEPASDEPASDEEENTEDDETPEQTDVELVTILTGTYSWLEQSEAVKDLQEALEIEADGWYGSDTRTAHIAALEERELAIETVPGKPCPAQSDLEESVGSIASTGDPILIDVDGDGTMDEASIVVVGETPYVTVATSFNGSVAWVEAIGEEIAADASYMPQFGTDINEDGLHELWVKTIPVSEPTGEARTHFMYVFVDCSLQVVTNGSNGSPYNLPRGEMLDTGGLLYINCVTLGEEPIMVYHEDYPIGEPEDGDYVWAYVPTPLRLVETVLELVSTTEIKRDIVPAPNPLPADDCPKWS